VTNKATHPSGLPATECLLGLNCFEWSLIAVGKLAGTVLLLIVSGVVE
jgi:hypothetical protein